MDSSECRTCEYRRFWFWEREKSGRRRRILTASGNNKCSCLWNSECSLLWQRRFRDRARKSSVWGSCKSLIASIVEFCMKLDGSSICCRCWWFSSGCWRSGSMERWRRTSFMLKRSSSTEGKNEEDASISGGEGGLLGFYSDNQVVTLPQGHRFPMDK